MSQHPILDAASGGIVLGSMFDYLPRIAAVVGLIWYGMMIYDWIIDKLAARAARNDRSGPDADGC